MAHEYIARISYGKDSLKMLEVIHSRGLPLDRITTTDVWATDTISANLPPMEEFKARMDERIWQLYRIQVEHLCARNKDGTKKTYEQMFYHVPVRRSQSVQVERASSRRATLPDSPCLDGHGVKQNLNGGPTEHKEASRDSRQILGTTGARNLKFVGQAIKGFPLSRQGHGVKWCQDLKTQAKPCFPMSAR